MALLVLLPPSESKSSAVGRGKSFASAHPDYARDVEPVLQHLRHLPRQERVKFHGVSTLDKADAAHALNLAALESPGLPALARHTGVVYSHIGLDTLLHPAHARNHILIVSALFGLIPGTAPIPDYKLPMNSWLAKYWKPINTERLAALAKGRIVLSLLPGAYAAALAYEPLIRVDFKLAGGKASAGHFGKAIKGKFVRYLMENKVRNLDGIANFSEDGYVFDGTNFVKH